MAGERQPSRLPRLPTKDGKHLDFIDRHDVLALIRAEFLRVDPAFDLKKATRRRKLTALRDRLSRQQSEVGHPLAISAQIADEINWLLNYGADWDRIDRRLCDLEASLDSSKEDMPYWQEISKQDDLGSWGPGFSEPFMLIEPTVDALQAKKRPSKLKPLKFLKCFEDGEFLLSYLHGLQISDIDRTLRNHRDELGAVLAGLSQIFFKRELRHILRDHRELDFLITPRLTQIYCDFVNQTQHPRTGYWGPWYRFGDKLLQVQDLSYTFHHISYRRGYVNNWKYVIDTTLAIKKLTYPAGWSDKEEGRYTNHNLYDVATIFSLGWRHATLDQRVRIRKEMTEVIAWSFSNTLDISSVRGVEFRGDPTPGLEDYYFGVRFLDRAGFWAKDAPFWSDAPIAPPKGVSDRAQMAHSLLTNFDRLRDCSELAEEVRSILCRAIGSGSAPGGTCQQRP